MLHPTLATNLAIFSIVPLILNAVSIYPVSRRLSNPSCQPLLLLLFVDCALSLVLLPPFFALIQEEGIFGGTSCSFYGSFDLCASIFQVSVITLVAFDRYVGTIQPKWGVSFRCQSIYTRILCGSLFVCIFWSALPLIGYGRFSVFVQGTVCSLDWTLGELAGAKNTGNASLDQMNDSLATGYVALLTTTFLLFFLIPVCVACSLYYAISDHVDKVAAAEARDDPTGPRSKLCTWAPNNHVTKVGLGCVIVSTFPFLAYAFVCLNPAESTHGSATFFLTPLIISRFSCLLNPVFYVWLNPEIYDVETKVLKKFKKKTPPPRSYQTINLIADLPCMSLPILTPTIPRRQLPKIPPHLLSPSHTPRNTLCIPEERPLLG